MTTITKEIIKQKKRLEFVYRKVEEGCQLFNDDMPTEAEITFRKAMQYSEDLVDEHPERFSSRVLLAETHHILSLAFSNIEEYDKAHVHLTEAFTIYQGINKKDFLYEQILNSTMARIENAERHYRNASKILERIIDDIEQHPEEELSKDGYLYCSDILLLAQVYFESEQYEKASNTIRRIIQLKKDRKASLLNQHPQDFINLMNSASFKALEREDDSFHLTLLEEGIAACQQAEASGIKIDLLCYGTFYQDLMKVLFFTDDKESIKRRYEELMTLCDNYLKEEPRLWKYKISGRLNYAVFCGKNGDREESEDIVCEAISECTEIGEEGPEMTLFMVSALNILSNLQWEQGESRGALRDLSSECKILQDFLESHPDMSPALKPLFFDLMLNQTKLHYELGEPEKGEGIIEDIKAGFDIHEGDYQEPSIGSYILVMLKIANLHWSLGKHDLARQEYQELLYILKEMESQLPEMLETIQAIEGEIRGNLSRCPMDMAEE